MGVNQRGCSTASLWGKALHNLPKERSFLWEDCAGFLFGKIVQGFLWEDCAGPLKGRQDINYKMEGSKIDLIFIFLAAPAN
jgi:hypothetical protein